jgi:hypothetical protein
MGSDDYVRSAVTYCVEIKEETIQVTRKTGVLVLMKLDQSWKEAVQE